MKAANFSESHVQKFCSEISCTQPVSVVCKPQYQEDENECFQLVQDKIEELGGTSVTGWAIWEKEGIFIEAEFHAVWLNSEGKYIDLNPRHISSKLKEILFIPDEQTRYKNKQIDNIRKPLVDDAVVKKFLHLNSKMFEFMNRGERAFQHGEIELSIREKKEHNKLLKELIKLELKINKKYGVVVA
ncbi:MULTISPECIES: hypothetical protein [unclassified Pseudoalteromonas]|uniref:hypothetical protein n=1 Tax=unclassified Pseudoalteromonas TaxID=194690 RepID=UPI0020976D33|nr:hypothetical protein [Pseudoalteromonas sp. XMcav2-N]MCO7188624.1 hypothetical protein [Pseudoalteromonas sp. XMcav2-N]